MGRKGSRTLKKPVQNGYALKAEPLAPTCAEVIDLIGCAARSRSGFQTVFGRGGLFGCVHVTEGPRPPSEFAMQVVEVILVSLMARLLR